MSWTHFPISPGAPMNVTPLIELWETINPMRAACGLNEVDYQSNLRYFGDSGDTIYASHIHNLRTATSSMAGKLYIDTGGDGMDRFQYVSNDIYERAFGAGTTAWPEIENLPDISPWPSFKATASLPLCTPAKALNDIVVMIDHIKSGGYWLCQRHDYQQNYRTRIPDPGLNHFEHYGTTENLPQEAYKKISTAYGGQIIYSSGGNLQMFARYGKEEPAFGDRYYLYYNIYDSMSSPATRGRTSFCIFDIPDITGSGWTIGNAAISLSGRSIGVNRGHIAYYDPEYLFRPCVDTLSIGSSIYNQSAHYADSAGYTDNLSTGSGSATIPFDPNFDYGRSYNPGYHQFWGAFTGLHAGQQNAIAMRFSQNTMDGLFQWVYRESPSGLWATGEVDRSATFGYKIDDDWYTYLYYQLVVN